jgi:hypothetical protein
MSESREVDGLEEQQKCARNLFNIYIFQIFTVASAVVTNELCWLPLNASPKIAVKVPRRQRYLRL